MPPDEPAFNVAIPFYPEFIGHFDDTVVRLVQLFQCYNAGMALAITHFWICNRTESAFFLFENLYGSLIA
jgi:hypothetical protein